MEGRVRIAVEFVASLGANTPGKGIILPLLPPRINIRAGYAPISIDWKAVYEKHSEFKPK